MGKRLYVGNLPYDADEEAIRVAFSAAGNVERVHIPLDRETQRPRGFAFVEMASDAEAKQALEAMNGFTMGTRTLRVSEAEDRRPPGPGGGPGGGGPRGPGGGGGQPRDRGERPDRGPRPERAPGGGGYSGGGGGGGGGGYSGGGGGGGGYAGGGGGGGGDTDDRANRFGPDAKPRHERERDRARKGGHHGRRRHDEGEQGDFHGRRGGRRFDDDDDE